jgi:hypothetical protein
MTDRVRLADWRDEAEIFSVLMELRATGSVAQLLPYSPRKVTAWIEVGCRPDPATRSNQNDKRQGMIGVVGEPGGRIIASTGLFFEEVWWSDVPILNQEWFYVRQEARRGARLYHDLFLWTIAIRDDLAARMKAAAGTGNEPLQPLLLQTTHASGDRVGAKDRLWSRYARRIGSVFIVGP